MRFIVYIVLLCLTALIIQSAAFAGGMIVHIQMTSQILADAGQPADRELTIYLPEGYDTSGLAYPVEYSIHGGGNNRDNITYGFVPYFDKSPNPLIVIMPFMGGESRNVKLEEAYLIEEIIPFVDENYRTIPYREGRSIVGVSRGGGDALHIVLAHPELFSAVGGVSAGGARSLPARQAFEDHPQKVFPLQFCLAYGLNEGGMTNDNQRVVSILKELGFPHLYVEDNGIHLDINALIQRGWICLKFVSEILGGGITPVEQHNKIVLMWGEIKDSE
jgi:hypothetical protein